MLYKVTPMLPQTSPMPKPRKSGRVRRRSAAIFDSEGQEVLITLMCLKCHKIKPLAQFGLRKMPDGAVRNQPWCRQCRGGAAATPENSSPPPLGAALLEVGPSDTSTP